MIRGYEIKLRNVVLFRKRAGAIRKRLAPGWRRGSPPETVRKLT